MRPKPLTVHEGGSTSERIIITKAGKPYLDMRAYREPLGQRRPGRLAGQIRIAPDFDAS